MSWVAQVSLIAQGLGLFYLAGAAITLFLVLRAILFEEEGELARIRLPKQLLGFSFAIFPTIIYGIAGLALLMKSDIAIPLLGAVMLLQAGMYALVMRRVQADEANLRWLKILTSVAMFTFATYAAQLGVLI